ncbi:hypothetical protein ACQ4PT_016474 [Festuca glaucescens]
MAAAADSSAVTIEPRSFDVVVCGTGLPESILAAACAAAGKTVLHVDPNPFYGSHFSSSVPPHALPSFLLSSASAACAAAGKTVLHVDPNPFYGSHFSSSVPPTPSRHSSCPPPLPPPHPPVIPPVLRLFPLHTLLRRRRGPSPTPEQSVLRHRDVGDGPLGGQLRRRPGGPQAALLRRRGR